MTSNSRFLSRREVLRRIGGGFGVIGLASVMAEAGFVQAASENPLAPRQPHFTPRTRRLIFLFMNGGPSHVDTFDPKPALARDAGQSIPDSWQAGSARRNNSPLMGSPFRSARFGQSGIEATEIYPEIGASIDDLCVVRSMYTDNPNHEPGLLLMNTGNMQPIRPSMGSWLTYALGSDNQNLPGFVVLCPGRPVVGPQLWSNSFLPGIYQGTHINNRTIDPQTIIRDVNNRYLSLPEQRAQLDLLQQMNQAHFEQRGRDEQLEARIASLEMAFRMQGEAQEAFDIRRETEATRRQYGDGEFANACLIARRLAERGVRVVQIYYGNNQPWDDHTDINNHRNHARASDRPIAALLKDLKTRGLFEDTLVVWGGEFGRTPMSQGARGRDHHHLGFCMWLAGGGVKRGHVHGATDEYGYRAIENRM
ncbi:MAG: DUF1501 domain-containing protein, partial [Gemmataceae bacterium]|nr:DUF1501 domain-containing protein [Gemmataceae bacterium]